MRWSTIVMSMAGLAVFEGVVSRTSASKSFGGVIAGAGKAVHWFLSPAVPFFNPSTTATLTTAQAPTPAPAATATLA